MAQDYIYDVFISYRHKAPMGDWVRNHFHPLLEQWLPEYLPIDHEPSIFIDWEMETGTAWPAKLRQALQTSRCILAVWSPQYFRSAWCLAEWKTMLKRHELLGMGTPQNPAGLIYPVTFAGVAGGEHFPEEARNIQSKDLRKWNIPYPSFKETKDFIDLDKEVQRVCEELGNMILRAPPWDDWPVLTPEAKPDIQVSLPRL